MKMKFHHLIEETEKWSTLSLYEASFPEDRGAYARYYYQWKCRDNEVFVLTDEDEEPRNDTISFASEEIREKAICAMLHLNPYQMWISTKVFQVHYIVAVATARPYRRRGCMRRLLAHAFSWLYEQKEPFTYLMPANTAYYEPFGFCVIYDQKPVCFPEDIEEANRMAKEKFDVVTLRDPFYMDFLKAEPDIEEATEEWKKEPTVKPEQEQQIENLPRDLWNTNDETNPTIEAFAWKPQIMSRMIHVECFLECLRADREEKICLYVEDPLISENNTWFYWQVNENRSRVKRLENNFRKIKQDKEIVCDAEWQGMLSASCLRIKIEDLTEQLFGIKALDPVLSHVKALRRICINEEV